MARHGIPDKIVSDNGPQFSSQEFKKFKDLYEFDHVTSSPTYPQSNGKVVKTAQRIMLKESEAGIDPYLGFLDFHNTPTEGLGTSPAQRLFGQRTKTVLLTSLRLLKGNPNLTPLPSFFMPRRTNKPSITTMALRNSGHLNQGTPFISIPPNIVNNGPQQQLTNKLVNIHTKLSLTTEGCIAGTTDSCLSQLKPLNNHLMTWRYVALILVPCPWPKLTRHHQ